jgi:hypothetical protein
MTRPTLATLAIAILLLSGSPSRIEAQGNTKIVIQDSGSILLRPDGLDSGANWTLTKSEIRHKNVSGILAGLEISEAGTAKCANPTCGIDATKPWKIQLVYGSGSITLSSISANKGMHLRHRSLPFDQWKKTTNADEREFGHGDGNKITEVKVNGGPNLCAGKGCVIALLYTPK